LVLGDPLQCRCVVSLERELHDEMTLSRRLDDLRVGRVQVAELLIEVSGQWLWEGTHHDLSKILRSAGVESHPVMRSHVVGSIVSSITTSVALGNYEPARVGLTPLQATAPVLDDDMAVPDRLLRLDDRDPPSSELVQSGLRGEQLIGGIRHHSRMIDAWDALGAWVANRAGAVRRV
jgi:hypothetical protein